MLRRALPLSLSGFTLIELLMAMGVFTFLIGIALPVTLNSARRSTLDSDRDTMVTLMVSARDKALSNTNQSPQGVAITASAYVQYQGSSYATRTVAYDLSHPRTDTLTISGGTEVVFAPLTGQTTAATLIFSDGQQQRTVSMNAEGMIDW